MKMVGFSVKTSGLVLLITAHLALVIPPLRFPAAVFLAGFLPGYFLVIRTNLWKDPLFAAVGSVCLSFLLTPPIAVIGGMIFRGMGVVSILLILNVYFLSVLWSFPSKKKPEFGKKEHHPLFPFMLYFICLGIFIYLDRTGLGPYAEDWTYLYGIIKELSRSIPPRDPEASFLWLKYPWLSYSFYAVLHRLGGISAWKVLEFAPVLLAFGFLGLIYMILFQATGNRRAGLWGVLLFAVGRETEWLIRGLEGLGWDPFFLFDSNWPELRTHTVYTLLWGWYLLPNMMGPLLSLFFLIRYDLHGNTKDYVFSLGTCSMGCLFHPAYYLLFLIGFSCWLCLRWRRHRFEARLLLFFAAFLPYVFTFYLPLQPKSPSEPFYLFFMNPTAVWAAFRNLMGHNGIAVPFAIVALWVSREARQWFLPFAGPLFFLSIVGKSEVNQLAYFLFPTNLFLTLLAALGWDFGMRRSRFLFLLLLLTTSAVVIPPCIAQLNDRLGRGWSGAVDSEQMRAGDFIRENTEADSTFLVLPDSRYALATTLGLGERKVVLGCLFHLNRYESEQLVRKVIHEVLVFLTTPEKDVQDKFLRKYSVDYLFIGPDERGFMERHGVDEQTRFQDYPTVFKGREIRIYRVTRNMFSEG